MIGFLPISIVSAGMSLLRTGAGALSAFFGSSDKQFTSTYASTLTASRGMRRRPLNSYLKLSRIVERNPSKQPTALHPSTLKNHSATDPNTIVAHKEGLSVPCALYTPKLRTILIQESSQQEISEKRRYVTGKTIPPTCRTDTTHPNSSTSQPIARKLYVNSRNKNRKLSSRLVQIR